MRAVITSDIALSRFERHSILVKRNSPRRSFFFFFFTPKQNYVEYQSFPSLTWKACQFEQSCVELLRTTQFSTYVTKVKTTDCQVSFFWFWIFAKESNPLTPPQQILIAFPPPQPPPSPRPSFVVFSPLVLQFTCPTSLPFPLPKAILTSSVCGIPPPETSAPPSWRAR